jgi:hypothetical protein
MRRFIFLLTVFFVLTFFNCDKKPEPGFDLSLIPGTYYSCQISYHTPELFTGEIQPGTSIEDLSSINGTIIISNLEENKFSLSINPVLTYSIPDLDITTLPVSLLNSAVGIKYLENDPNYIGYSGFGAGKSYMGYTGYYPPYNHFEINESINEISFHFTIKSKNPDSLYFLDFWGSRLY